MSDKIQSHGLTRRQFLKTTAATAAVIAVSDKLFGGKTGGLVQKAEAAKAPAQDGWFPGVCKMCMQGDCQTRVHVVDGVVVKVEGDPRAVQNAGALCPRGNSAIANMYNAWRVKAPMKRTNPKKGLNEDPKFVEITWDEAVNTVAERLKKLKADDPRKVIVVSGFGVRSQLLGNWETAFGTPNDVPSRGSACAYHLGSYLTNGSGPDNVPDIEKSEYIINIARTLGPNIAVSSVGTRHTMDALARGCKIVNVDPRCGPEASKMDWVPIRPGTEQAFLLGMLYSVLYEIKVMDTWFVKNRTNAPYLIGPDGEYVIDVASKKPLIWDEKENRARAFDEIPPMNSALEGKFTVNGVACSPAFQLIKDAVKTYTPEWAEKISTIPAAKIREIAKDFIGHAHIGDTVTIDGVTMPFRPVSIQYEKGAYQHTIEGTFGDLVGKILCELVGCLEVPGGQTGNSTPSQSWLQPGTDGVRKPISEAAGIEWVWPPNKIDADTFYPVSHTKIWAMARAILDPKKYHIPYEPEVLLAFGGGPIRSGFGRKVYEQAFAKIPFLVTSAITYDENAVLSDIILADDAFLEKDQLQAGSSAPPGHKVMVDVTRGARFFLFRDASKITKPYNTRSLDQVLLDLAERIGFLTGKGGMVDVMNGSIADFKLDNTKKPTLRQHAEATLKQTFGAKYSLADVNDANGPFYNYATRGAKNYNYSYWPDNKVRHPMYFIQLLRVGRTLKKNIQTAGLSGVPGWKNMDDFWKAFQAIPVWTPCPEFNPPPEYDMWAINWKTPMGPFFCGDTYGNVWLHEAMSTFDPYEYSIWMNSKTAAKKGIKDGDTIVVESRYGKAKGRVKVTELIHPDVVGFPAGHGAASPMANPITAEGAYFNDLCSSNEEDLCCDPLTAGIEEGPAVKVYKA